MEQDVLWRNTGVLAEMMWFERSYNQHRMRFCRVRSKEWVVRYLYRIANPLVSSCFNLCLVVFVYLFSILEPFLPYHSHSHIHLPGQNFE